MKNPIKIVFVSFSFLLFWSCSLDLNQENTEAPYYTFNNQDRSFMINYQYVAGQTIPYVNQSGDTLHFRVLENQTSKNASYSDGSLSGGEGLLENYYDSKIIQLEILENPSTEPYALVNYIFSKNNNTLNTGINFPMWNLPLFSFIDEIQNSVNIFTNQYQGQTTSSVSINGHQFNKVITINTNSNDSGNDDRFGPLLQNVNEILYDYDFGIIQFKDINDTIWRVDYPQ